MSLKRNIIFSYASQIYVTLVGILFLPIYSKYMGAEAYGLVGFFGMLQACFGLLDLGLSPSIGRETARYRGGAISATVYRHIYRALSLIFLVIALVGGFVLWLFADTTATKWLNVRELPKEDVILALQIMAVSVSLRWMGGLYRGVITGSERLAWISIFNAIMATLRFAGVFGSMVAYGFTPFVFFSHQLVVAVAEVVGLFFMSRNFLPSLAKGEKKLGWSLAPVLPLVKFSLTIAFTSSVWILVTQLDKFVLSGVLSLSEYGYFTLAVLVANGIMVVSSPVSAAIMPRMARLYAEDKEEEVISVYRNASRLVSSIAGSLAITLFFCADHILFAWTGDAELVSHASPILKLYAIGNGLLALGAFPYYMQYAKGDLKYHLIGNALLLLFLVPLLVYFAKLLGGIGAAWVWVGLNGAYLFLWVSYVHSKLIPGLGMRWLLCDFGVICAPAALLGLLGAQFPLELTDRFTSLLYSAALGGSVLFIALIAKKICSGLALGKLHV